MKDYRRLVTWRKAHALYLNVYRAMERIRRPLPPTLRSQVSRAADSVVTNIVEGAGAGTPKDFARFLDMSIKSNGELQYHITKVRDLGMMPATTADHLAEDAIEVRKMTYGLKRRILENGSE